MSKSQGSRIEALENKKKPDQEAIKSFNQHLELYWEKYPEKYQRYQELMDKYFPNWRNGEHDVSKLSIQESSEFAALFDEFGINNNADEPAQAGKGV